MRLPARQQPPAGFFYARTTMTTPKRPAKRKAARVPRGLNAMQQRFVLEYLVDLNATQAAIRAGYSQKTAGAQAHDLLKKPEIQEAIAAARDATSRRLELTREDCIRQYQRIAFSDPRKLFSPGGGILPITDLDDDTAAAVQGYEIEYRQIDGADAPPVPVLKIKWADRKGALDSIMRSQGWNAAEKHEHTGKGGGPIETKVVMVPAKVPAMATTRPLERTDD